jgi:hypothetical protein
VTETPITDADRDGQLPPASARPTKPKPRRRRRRRILLAVASPALLAMSVLTAHLFIWPDLPPLAARADVIVQLGGPGDRRTLALDLARQHRAPLVAISVSTAEVDTT